MNNEEQTDYLEGSIYLLQEEIAEYLQKTQLPENIANEIGEYFDQFGDLAIECLNNQSEN